MKIKVPCHLSRRWEETTDSQCTWIWPVWVSHRHVTCVSCDPCWTVVPGLLTWTNLKRKKRQHCSDHKESFHVIHLQAVLQRRRFWIFRGKSLLSGSTLEFDLGWALLPSRTWITMLDLVPHKTRPFIERSLSDGPKSHLMILSLRTCV